MGSSYEQALKTLEKTFKDRIRRPSRESDTKSGALASVLPLHAEEVELLAREAARYSMPLAAVGGGTSPEPVAEEGKLLVRFDLMRGVRLPDRDGGWAEAEPGTPWLKLDEELRLRDMGLALYPTSAPRATVGGWLATDGLGVGSFEFGRLRENVLSASVVLPGGERREVPGEEVGSFLYRYCRGDRGLRQAPYPPGRCRHTVRRSLRGRGGHDRRGDRPVRYECAALAPGSPEPGHGARQKP